VKASSARHRTLPGARRLRDGSTLYWWAEVLAIIIYYVVYSAIRNTNSAGEIHAFHNAKHIIHLERLLGIYHEQTMQEWALHFKPLIISANWFYGSLHFIVTIAAGVYLFRKFSDDYPRFRNTLAIATGLALIGFRLFPLMPPRLLHTMGHPGFVDTLDRYPTPWSFDSGAVSKISNQFAAMPSVHICWATWCALVFAPRVKQVWTRVLAIAYPFFTLVVIVITANHYILDAAGGLAVLGVGWVLANQFTRAGRGDPVIAGP
jgi:PAP2 superfamily